MTPEELIIAFVHDKLMGNIDLLATFPLASLQYDKTFLLIEGILKLAPLQTSRIWWMKLWKNLTRCGEEKCAKNVKESSIALIP